MKRPDLLTVLCLALTVLCGGLLVCGFFFAPSALRLYVESTGRPESIIPDILRTFYAAAPFALGGMFVLAVLLVGIMRGEIFVRRNAVLLRVLALCAAAASVLCAAVGWRYLPLLLCAGVGFFLSVIVAVLSRLFFAAAEIKAENALTI